MVNSGTKAATVIAAEKNTAVSTSIALIRIMRIRSVHGLACSPPEAPRSRLFRFAAGLGRERFLAAGWNVERVLYSWAEPAWAKP